MHVDRCVDGHAAVSRGSDSDNNIGHNHHGHDVGGW